MSFARAVLNAAPHTLVTRGDAAMSKPKRRQFKREGNIVYTTKIGNTTIRICDDFVARTPEEIEKVLDEMHAAGWAIIESLQRKDDGNQA